MKQLTEFIQKRRIQRVQYKLNPKDLVKGDYYKITWASNISKEQLWVLGIFDHITDDNYIVPSYGIKYLAKEDDIKVTLGGRISLFEERINFVNPTENDLKLLDDLHKLEEHNKLPKYDGGFENKTIGIVKNNKIELFY